MEQYPASRAPHGRDSCQRSAAPYTPMETAWEQAALQRCRVDPYRGWSRDLSIGGTSRFRCRLRAAVRTHFQRAIRYQPQPDVCGLDLALCWRCAHHAKRMDDRITSSHCRAHPPGCSSRGARFGASVRARVRPLQEAGSSIPLAIYVQRRPTMCWRRRRAVVLIHCRCSTLSFSSLELPRGRRPLLGVPERQDVSVLSI
jgi:hypothetical protein